LKPTATNLGSSKFSNPICGSLRPWRFNSVFHLRKHGYQMR
jgi:hypothetical protein